MSQEHQLTHYVQGRATHRHCKHTAIKDSNSGRDSNRYSANKAGVVGTAYPYGALYRTAFSVRIPQQLEASHASYVTGYICSEHTLPPLLVSVSDFARSMLQGRGKI